MLARVYQDLILNKHSHHWNKGESGNLEKEREGGRERERERGTYRANTEQQTEREKK